MDEKIALALLPFLGVILGAFLQYFFTTRRENQQQNKQLKIEAYTDYLQAAAQVSSREEADHISGRVKLTDAKIRIAVYGSEEVIRCVADFDRHGSKLDNAENQRRFVKIIKAMRVETKKDNTRSEDFGQMLFSSDLV